MLVSGFASSSGPPAWLLERVAIGRIDLILPDLVVDEMRRTLSRKLEWDGLRIAGAEAFLRRHAAKLVEAPQRAEALTGDPADDRILACAAEAKADALVTGDRRHLLPLGVYRGVRILKPQTLLAELTAAHESD